MKLKTEYDSTWDLDGDESGYVDGAFDLKYEEWEKRDWDGWLRDNLTFPFEVERVEDLESNPFVDEPDQPFSCGHKMIVLDLDEDDDKYGFIVKVKEGNQTGYLPLADLEVTSRDDKNFWPVREYAVWNANH